MKYSVYTVRRTFLVLRREDGDSEDTVAEFYDDSDVVVGEDFGSYRSDRAAVIAFCERIGTTPICLDYVSCSFEEDVIPLGTTDQIANFECRAYDYYYDLLRNAEIEGDDPELFEKYRSLEEWKFREGEEERGEWILRRAFDKALKAVKDE